MGYDVNFYHKIKHPTKNTEYLVEVDTSLNVTYNIREMFYVASDGYYLSDLDTLSKEEIKKVLGHTLFNLNARDYKKYNSPNGWGTQQGLLRFVKEFYDEFIEKDIDLVEIY